MQLWYIVVVYSLQKGVRKMRKIVISIATLIAALFTLAFPSFAAVHTTFGQTVNASSCNAGSSPIVNVIMKVLNDDDSATLGNVWALDNYVKTVSVYPQPDGTFCAVVKTQGGFTTVAGNSPGAAYDIGGTVGAGVTGTFEGGYIAQFDGTFSPILKTKGNIGTFDYNCDLAYNCPGFFDWVSAYFTGNTFFNLPYWAWNYHAGNNGSWVNAITGNSGDITGS